MSARTEKQKVGEAWERGYSFVSYVHATLNVINSVLQLLLYLTLFSPYILAKACVDEHPWSHARRTGMGEDWQCLCAQPWTTTVSGVCILVWFPDCTGMGTGNQTK